MRALRPLVEWLPGETLFSLCSRYHHISGHRSSSQTCQALFGSPRTGPSHDVASCVQNLVDRTQGHLGNAQVVLLAHTLIPFYFPFHQELSCLNWLAQITTGSSPILKAQLGLAASQFGSAHPLKACPLCMDSDTKDHGVAYWHVDHQLPGVFICPRHFCALQFASDKVSGQDRFGWVLPRQARLISLTARPDHEFGDMQFAEFAASLWRLPPSFTFALDRLGKLYRQKLVEGGFIDPATARVRHQQFEHSIQKSLFSSSMPIHWPWLASHGELHNFSQRLLRMTHPTSPRWSRHPLNHLPLLVMLFGSWQAFWDAYRLQDLRDNSNTIGYGTPVSTVVSGAVVRQNSPRSLVINLIRSGRSVSQAAKLAAVSVGTAMTWAADEGIQSPRRPKVLKAPVRSILIQELKCGTSKAQAASQAGVTVQSVTRLLFTEPGLHQQWQETCFINRQKDHRAAWQTIQAAFPENSSADWRRLNPATYAWLYRNDRAWLKRSIQERPRPAATAPQRRDWHSRDVALAQAVRESAVQLQLSQPGKRVTIGQICASVSGLRQKMSVLMKLPLTRVAIQQACSVGKSKADSSQANLSL